MFVKVSSMEERFHIHSSEMEDRKTEMKNIVTAMDETLTFKIHKIDENMSIYTKEKFKELIDYLETEKVEHFEVIKLLGLTHSLLNLAFTNNEL